MSSTLERIRFCPQTPWRPCTVSFPLWRPWVSTGSSDQFPDTSCQQSWLVNTPFRTTHWSELGKWLPDQQNFWLPKVSCQAPYTLSRLPSAATAQNSPWIKTGEATSSLRNTKPIPSLHPILRGFFPFYVALKQLRLTHNKRQWWGSGGTGRDIHENQYLQKKQCSHLGPLSNKISLFTSSSWANTGSSERGFSISLNSLLDLLMWSQILQHHLFYKDLISYLRSREWYNMIGKGNRSYSAFTKGKRDATI